MLFEDLTVREHFVFFGMVSHNKAQHALRGPHSQGTLRLWNGESCLIHKAFFHFMTVKKKQE